MRILVLFRGSPSCGKSTFIKKNGLEPYSLSADNIRLMCQSPILKVEGGYGISQKNDKKVWELLYDILEQRMIRGEFIVVDATNSKTIEINRYKNIAETYRYRIICVDMTDIPIDVCKERNRNRLPEYKIVPDFVIDNMYARFENQSIPSGIKIVKPNELNDIIKMNTLDFSEYKKIHHIGDLHGCNTVLQEYLKDGLKEDELYIFLGDYIDRGIENSELLEFLFTIAENLNVILLQGNHEQWLWMYGNDMKSGSKEFEKITKYELNNSRISKKKIRMLYRKLRQIAYYTYNDKTVIVTHGGINGVPNDLHFIATEQMIKGVGEYKDMELVNKTFINSTPSNYYQIHGHRNVSDAPVKINDRCFCLEGKVEFGGNLRIVTLDNNGFTCIEVKNNVFKELNSEVTVVPQVVNCTNQEIIQLMRDNTYIRESKFDNISSFSFTEQAFKKGIWDDQTIKARGLFFNTNTGDIVARSYEKFFNINEKENTKLDNLKNVFQFPVKAYVKYNGFLGLVGYDKETDMLLVSSKSNPDSPFAGYFRDIFDEYFNDDKQLTIKRYLKNNNVTFVMEVIDPINDPHMIEYKKQKLVLLDIVENNMEFNKKDYLTLFEIGSQLDIEIKEEAFILNDWREFYQWYEEITADDYKYKGEYIEGFVLEDSVGFMTKLKLQFYSFWKFMRGVKESVGRKGYIDKTSALNSPLANQFYGWLKGQTKEVLRKDIITLRNMYYKELSE